VRAELLFASEGNRRRVCFELSLPKNATVNDLFRTLKKKLSEATGFRKSVLFGIGVEFVERSYLLTDGDVIAIMPPVQGGYDSVIGENQKSEIRFGPGNYMTEIAQRLRMEVM
jgi:molybdopterin converting factor small subunit